jgi:hypothetical protein
MNLDEQDEKDELWQLLGKARQPAVSPFFSRNVMRAVRGLAQERPGVLASLLRYWRLAALSGCAASLAVGTMMIEQDREHRREHQEIIALAERVSASPDYEVIGHLDELLDSEKNSVWLDNNNAY